MSDFIVKIEYKIKNEDNELQTVVEKEYGFPEYTDMLYVALMSILKDVENVFYDMCDGAQKEEWPPEVWARFKTLRNKILDEANSIRRLPQCLSYHGVSASSISSGEWIAKMLNGK